MPALDGVWLDQIDLEDFEERKIHISYAFIVNGEVVSENSCLFTAPKHYFFEDPRLSVRAEGNKVTVRAEKYAKNVMIGNADGSLKLSDNFFDMEAGEKTVEVLEGNTDTLSVRSVYNIA